MKREEAIQGGAARLPTLVYIIARGRNGTLYVGVTSDLPKRAWQHREGVSGGFTKQHGCKVLVWYELHSTMEYAMAREKQLKAGSRKKKLALVESANPQWRDLFGDISARRPGLPRRLRRLAMTKGESRFAPQCARAG